jgi:hypothetical protein
MAGEIGGGGKGQVARIESEGRPVTPEDVWNAAIRAGVDPARMALSLCHVLGEVSLIESEAGEEDEPVGVRYTLKNGHTVSYDAGFYNPFKHLADDSSERGPAPASPGAGQPHFGHVPVSVSWAEPGPNERRRNS